MSNLIVYVVDVKISTSAFFLNSFFPASRNFYHLPINLANSSDQDQAQQNVGPDLDRNWLTLMIFLIFFRKLLILKKINRQPKITCKVIQHAMALIKRLAERMINCSAAMQL